MKRVCISMLGIMAVIFLVGCDSLWNQFGFISNRQINATKDKLKSTAQHLPTPPGSVLIESVERMSPSRMVECTTLDLDRLIGSNEMSFSEVLDFYSSTLPSAGWQVRLVANDGRTFEFSGEIHLEVSDNYEFVPISKAAIREGKSKFRTMFLVEMFTPAILPVPKQCKES